MWLSAKSQIYHWCHGGARSQKEELMMSARPWFAIRSDKNNKLLYPLDGNMREAISSQTRQLITFEAIKAKENKAKHEAPQPTNILFIFGLFLRISRKILRKYHWTANLMEINNFWNLYLLNFHISMRSFPFFDLSKSKWLECDSRRLPFPPNTCLHLATLRLRVTRGQNCLPRGKNDLFWQRWNNINFILTCMVWWVRDIRRRLPPVVDQYFAKLMLSARKCAADLQRAKYEEAGTKLNCY